MMPQAAADPRRAVNKIGSMVACQTDRMDLGLPHSRIVHFKIKFAFSPAFAPSFSLQKKRPQHQWRTEAVLRMPQVGYRAST
jgi:hypothetical protein